MRYLLIVLAFVSGMLCTERAMASEAEDFYEYASYFHGTWISEQEGTESIVVCEAKETYNLCSFNGGMAHEIWGYDPVKKVWAGYGRGGDSSWECDQGFSGGYLGDSNFDGNIDVLDIVNVVSLILGN